MWPLELHHHTALGLYITFFLLAPLSELTSISPETDLPILALYTLLHELLHILHMMH